MSKQRECDEDMLRSRPLLLVAILLASSGLIVVAVTPFFGSQESLQNKLLSNDNQHSDPTGFEHARQWAGQGGDVSDEDLVEEDEDAEEEDASPSGRRRRNVGEEVGVPEQRNEDGFVIEGDEDGEESAAGGNGGEGESEWQVVDDDDDDDNNDDDSDDGGEEGEDFHDRIHSEQVQVQEPGSRHASTRSAPESDGEDKLWYEEDEDEDTDEFGSFEVRDTWAAGAAGAQSNTKSEQRPRAAQPSKPQAQQKVPANARSGSTFAERIRKPNVEESSEAQAGSHLPIVVLVHDRAQALRRLLESIENAVGADLGLVWVYQDGTDRAVELVVRDFHPARLVRLPARRPGDGAPVLHSRLTHNYRFMMEHSLAANPWAQHIIVLEDDLIVSPDFISFFSRAAKVMDADPTILCASGYNDNGFESNTADPHQIWRGEHFMALGWLLSREVYQEVQVAWNMDQVWDVPFAVRMSADVNPPYECIYPEVPRTKHVGDSAMRGALTTSAAAQQNWFDLIHLHASEGGVPEDRMMEAAADEHERVMNKLIEGGSVVQCLWEMIAGSDETFLFLFEATAPRFSEDVAWDWIAEKFGLLGRGGGWDRLPRGIHRGTTRTRVNGNLVLFISSSSPYAQHPKLAALAPFPTAPEHRDALVGGDCRAPPTAVEEMMGGWQVFEDGGQACDALCSSKGLQCDAASLWAAAVDSQCSSLSQVLRRHSSELSCSGCDLAYGGIYAPTVDDVGGCRLPSLVAMTCGRANPRQPSTFVVCPCGHGPA